ncbi:MAG: transglycosylase SLT domain-containing protein, partial [Pseudomonadota bacterium]|nr:transglycosylase SLT domain-containing protein [Pseudomonadota bacterium]
GIKPPPAPRPGKLPVLPPYLLKGVNDPALVNAVCLNESRCRADSPDSTEGAVGIMQIKPSTAEWVAEKHGIHWDSVNLQDPLDNIRLGSLYLDMLKKRFGGHPVVAAMAYHIGPDKMEGHTKALGIPVTDAELEIFIGRIPSPENRIYGRQIWQNLDEYRRLLSGQPPQKPASPEPSRPAVSSVTRAADRAAGTRMAKSLKPPQARPAGTLTTFLEAPPAGKPASEARTLRDQLAAGRDQWKPGRLPVTATAHTAP